MIYLNYCEVNQKKSEAPKTWISHQTYGVQRNESQLSSVSDKYSLKQLKYLHFSCESSTSWKQDEANKSLYF